MPEYQSLTKVRLNAEIIRIKFSNPENGFSVVTLLGSDGKKFTAKGMLGPLGCGQHIEAEGYFEDHPDFGRQFRIDSCKAVPPATEEGIIRFLRYSVPGIGPKTANAIVKQFGKETVTVLDLYPKRVMEVPKIGKKMAEKISKAWKESRTQRDEMIFLQGLGITPAYCARLFKRYGSDAVAAVRKNPYQLAEDVDGIGFLKADVIARNLGFEENSPLRMQSAAVFALNSMIGDGHVCAPEKELIAECVKLTGQDEKTVAQGIFLAVERRLLYHLDGFFYTPLTAAAEVRLPGIIAKLAADKNFPGKRLQQIAAVPELKLDILQQQAVESLYKRPLNIITGGPGVGKTTVIGEIVRRAKKARLKFMLASPTGRAAKRMSETSNCEAKTLHRLLVFDPATNKFNFNRDNQLDCELLIVDEVSMLDIILAYQLFQAIPAGCSVVLVGDSDQLPSVGPGRVLNDFMASGFFGVTKLTKIFRQQQDSFIISNAHRVNSGKLPLAETPESGKLSDFYWIEQDDPAKAAAVIAALVTERIPKRFKFDPLNDIQVLSPMNRGECGTGELNEKLSSLLRGEDVPHFQVGNTVFKQGDRVMQNTNNYDKNVFNGDLGSIVMLDRQNHKFTVCFDDDRFVSYDFDEANQLNAAYAITIHKSQGSEFPVVVMPILSQHFVMLRRNLIYTGMTRAKKLLIIVGSRKAMEIAVNNTRVRPRYSLLAQRLQALFKKN